MAGQSEKRISDLQRRWLSGPRWGCRWVLSGRVGVTGIGRVGSRELTRWKSPTGQEHLHWEIYSSGRPSAWPPSTITFPGRHVSPRSGWGPEALALENLDSLKDTLKRPRLLTFCDCGVSQRLSNVTPTSRVTLYRWVLPTVTAQLSEHWYLIK